MSGEWRSWALTAAALLCIAGIALMANGGGPMLLIVGVVALLTAVLERTYGNPNGRPLGSRWRPTSERFIDPETGAPVTVWFDPATGERRYVAENEDALGG